MPTLAMGRGRYAAIRSYVDKRVSVGIKNNFAGGCANVDWGAGPSCLGRSERVGVAKTGRWKGLPTLVTRD